MEQPSRFVTPGQDSKVYKLKRSLCRLKQASKQWYEKIHKTIITFGFTVNDNDACVYIKIF